MVKSFNSAYGKTMEVHEQKIKVACFGLQGFGNDLLSALNKYSHIEIVGLYTRESLFPFKYYSCSLIESLAEKMSVPVFYIPEKGEWECVSADLAIISSFHRIFRKQHLLSYQFAINIHTALLPSYKGATPTNWMIKNGEKIVGLSAHLMNEEIDSGSIIFQHKILNPYLCDDQLRQVLSFLSRDIVNEIINSYPRYKAIPVNDANIHENYFPARSEASSLIKVEDLKNIEELIFHIKAFTNYPMPKISIGNRVFVIDYRQPTENVEIEVDNQRFRIMGYWLT